MKPERLPTPHQAPKQGPRELLRLANKGVGVRLLAEVMAGHSHISTTQRYIDVNSKQMRDAVELL